MQRPKKLCEDFFLRCIASPSTKKHRNAVGKTEMFDGQKGGSQGRGLVIEMQPRKNPSAHILLFFSCINNSYVNSRIRDMRLECECFMAKSNCIPSEDLEVQVNCGLLFLTDREYLPCIASVYLSFVLSFFHFFIDIILSASKLSFILQLFLYALGLYRQ